MNRSTGLESSLADALCLACGLCCNSVLFADVRLQAGDDAARLRSLGLPVLTPRAATHQTGVKTATRLGAAKRREDGRAPLFKQPCVALEGCHCRVYAERPAYCRKFECALFKSVSAGRTQPGAALELIRVALERADKVRRLLRKLGDADEQSPLRTRFRRTAKRMERADLDDATAKTYARLTLAFHDLNLRLSEAFYPAGWIAVEGQGR